MKKLKDQTVLAFNDISELELTPEIIRSVPKNLVLTHRVVPVHIDAKSITIALSDHTNPAAIDDIRFFIDCELKLVYAKEDSIERLITKHYLDGIAHDSGITCPNVLNTRSGFLDSLSIEQVLSYDNDVIVEIVNTIISDAIAMNASDVHIEPLETRLRIRYRIDGYCKEINSFPNELKLPIISRAKVMANMDLAEKRLPQDGRIISRISGSDVDIRASSLPVVHGESVVFRILDKTNVRKGLKTVGLFGEDYNRVMSIAAIPDGMIIISGPTGSGKTTSLYAILQELARSSIKIITIEDPIEYTLEGINQIEVQTEHGVDFELILRHILRHDPDVIMVGEMRDLKSVEIAMRSSLTGHKVLSTLHTNDAPSVITRFINMGLPPFMINASVQAVIYQRLVRILCPRCKIPAIPSKAEILLLIDRGQDTVDSRQGEEEMCKWKEVDGVERWEDEFCNFLIARFSEFDNFLKYIGNKIKWFRSGRCKECNFSGYKGRTAIFEIMLMDDEIKKLTMKRSSSMEIRKAALKHGMRDIRIDGMMKVIRGITSASEVIRVV